MKKKWLSAVAGVLAVLFTGGCASDFTTQNRNDNDTPISLKLWTYYNDVQQSVLDEIVDTFNQTVGSEKGIVLLTESKGGVTELGEAVVAAANQQVGADPMPDMFLAYSDWALDLDRLGVVAPLDSYFTQEELDAYIDSFLDEGRYDTEGNLKIFPVVKSSEEMMINKVVWEEFSAQKDVSLDMLETWEGVTETARLFYEWTDAKTPDIPDDGTAFFGIDSLANYMIVGTKQLGYDIFSTQNGKTTVSLEEGVLRRLWDHYYVPMIQGYFGEYGRFRSDDVKTEDLMGYVGSTSASAYFPLTVTKDDGESYASEPIVLCVPYFEGGEKFAVQQGAGMVITKSEDKRREEAAVTFLKWFTGTDINIDYTVRTGYLPVKKESLALDRIKMSLNEVEDANLRGILNLSFEVMTVQLDEYTLYQTKPFTGSVEARNILENSMRDRALQDLAEIERQMEAGSSRADAVAQFDTEENFQNWFTSLRQELAKVIS